MIDLNPERFRGSGEPHLTKDQTEGSEDSEGVANPIPTFVSFAVFSLNTGDFKNIPGVSVLDPATA
jgi:hypothetical protein